MSEHLPECFWTDTPLKPKKVRGLCICARLRDCEARVQLDEWGPLPDDSVAEGVRLLQTIGLDITNISAEARAAIDLYVLEEGPLKVEQTDDGQRLVAKQDVRLRLKSADELRADGQRDERERIRSDVLNLVDVWTDSDEEIAEMHAAIDGTRVRTGEEE